MKYEYTMIIEINGSCYPDNIDIMKWCLESAKGMAIDCISDNILGHVDTINSRVDIVKCNSWLSGWNNP